MTYTTDEMRRHAQQLAYSKPETAKMLEYGAGCAANLERANEFIHNLSIKIGRLEFQVDEARNQALEEAAQFCDRRAEAFRGGTIGNVSAGIAGAIRALKEKAV